MSEISQSNDLKSSQFTLETFVPVDCMVNISVIKELPVEYREFDSAPSFSVTGNKLGDIAFVFRFRKGKPWRMAVTFGKTRNGSPLTRDCIKVGSFIPVRAFRMHTLASEIKAAGDNLDLLLFRIAHLAETSWAEDFLECAMNAEFFDASKTPLGYIAEFAVLPESLGKAHDLAKKVEPRYERVKIQIGGCIYCLMKQKDGCTIKKLKSSEKFPINHPAVIVAYDVSPSSCDKNEVIGYAVLYKSESKYQLVSIGVHKDHRRKGVGTLLFRKAQNSVNGYLVSNDIPRDLFESLSFFKKMGSKIIENGESYSAIHLQKVYSGNG